ncbi:MAG: rod shape-determining protein [Lachnospiraceae bacterium]|nr:rod shape-determining protein [Lachnospiraceae bacterium]
MSEMENEKQMVFGLDIGTRNVVGTVGYKDGKEFRVVAQYTTEHDTRAMLDGQIHDIGRVGETIREVKEALEAMTDLTLTDVCIAAAGRVLKTVTTTVEYVFPEETVVTGEHIHTLDLLGVDQAQTILKEKNDTKYKFYVVGYTTVKYFLNDEVFSNLENHKAERIAEEIIVTFLPEDVVDGLYAAVGIAGLEVANMTLEPIAAINVAIPENYRMLNIALVDVGAGTSDISVTRDGSIIAYGMIPFAGDELTEVLVKNFLVDFNTAEKIKLEASEGKEIVYEDIMGIPHTITAEDVWKLTDPVVEKITTEVAEKIEELNGGEPVSATFIVGGGGKIRGFVEAIADKMDIPRERVALRGEEVLKQIVFEQKEIVKDPLIVTPVGICLNYYDKKNSFIMVTFNGERLKLYNNNHLTVVDAALQAGFPNEDLFPKRGREIRYSVNGRERIQRGESGESAVISLNDRPANLNTQIMPNCHITIEESTAGADAELTVEQLEEYQNSEIDFVVNGRIVTCPRFVEVNGVLESPSYRIQSGDRIETRSYYTVSQLAEFMDVTPNPYKAILVNNREADENTLVYENFDVEWDAEAVAYGGKVEHKEETSDRGFDVSPAASARSILNAERAQDEAAHAEAETEEPATETAEAAAGEKQTAAVEPAAAPASTVEPAAAEGSVKPEEPAPAPEPVEPEEPAAAEEPVTTAERPKQHTAFTAANSADRMLHDGPKMAKPLSVFVNGEEYRLDGKMDYVFVDIFNVIDFDLNESRGRAIVTTVNGENAQYTQKLNDGDKIEIYWKEKE